jgi:hypothetical protein
MTQVILVWMQYLEKIVVVCVVCVSGCVEESYAHL